jgi:uncharacterized SAM-binding protein YcdF (DUF218 family)
LSPAASRRVLRAAAAYRKFSPAIVIASGGRRWHGVSEADALARALTDALVPEEAIVRELCSLTTLENACYSAEILRASRVRRTGVVTCDWHMDRALAAFDRVGIDAIALPAVAPLGGASRLARNAAETARTWFDQRVASHWIDR